MPDLVPPQAPTPPASPTPTVPLLRRRGGRVVAGVAGGVADHLGVPAVWVRAVLVGLVFCYGLGAIGYALLWALVRQRPEGPAGPDDHAPQAVGTASWRELVRSTSWRRTGALVGERRQAAGVVAVGIGLVAGLAALGGGWAGQAVGWLLGPLGVAAVGAALVWREADDHQRRRAVAGRATRAATLRRVLVGGLLVTAGLVLYLFTNAQLSQVSFVVLAVLATLAGVAVLTVPWWLRTVRELGDERRERILAAERAEIAAHLHDSVLQTLALIQRQADRPREVQRLARGQERELRQWLYGPGGYGRGPASSARPAGFTVALAAAAAEVEDTYAVDVRPVVVGDGGMLDGAADGADAGRVGALLLAAREAMVNAAKHAGVAEISVFAEVEPGQATVFVRDRGRGFDPQTVPADRHGLADSVHGRMARHGGTVRLRSAPGQGTEVQLSMPLPEIRSSVRAGRGGADDDSEQREEQG